MNFNNVALVIQGYSSSKEDLKQIFDEYKSKGINNIVISSYSKFKFESKGLIFIENDSILGKFERKHHSLPNGKYRNCPTLNYQLLSCQKGIEAISNFENIEYILRIRADHRLNNIDLFLKKWIHEFSIMPTHSSPFEKKIITTGGCNKGSNHNINLWYISDNIEFGTSQDIKNMWNIPISYRDKFRAENYINTFYLSKHFSKKTNEDLEKEMSNDYINKYTVDVLKYFIFDKELTENLYSYKIKKHFNQYNAVAIWPKHPYHNFDYKNHE